MRALARSRAAGEGSGGQPIPRRFRWPGTPTTRARSPRSSAATGAAGRCSPTRSRCAIRFGVAPGPRRSAGGAGAASIGEVAVLAAASWWERRPRRAPVPDPPGARPARSPPHRAAPATRHDPEHDGGALPRYATPSAPGIPPSSAPTSRPGDDPPEPSLPTTAVTHPRTRPTAGFEHSAEHDDHATAQHRHAGARLHDLRAHVDEEARSRRRDHDRPECATHVGRGPAAVRDRVDVATPGL